MEFELKKERVTIDQRIGRENSQLLLEGDVLAPDVKPDILQVLKVDAKTVIERVEVMTDRVSYQGKLELTFLYISKDSDKPVNYMTGGISLDDFINLDGLSAEMSVDLEAEVTHLDYKLINDRKINVKAVLETTVCANAEAEKEIVAGIEGIPESQILKTPLKISRQIECKEDKFVIKEELALPSGKPNIREILNCRVEIANKEVRSQDGKVSVKGDLIVKTLFSGDTEGSVCEYMEHEIPFSGFIDAPGSAEGLYAEATLKVCSQYVQIKQDSDGEDRAIEVEVGVSAKIKVFSESCFDMIEDAYIINKSIMLEKDKIKYPKVVCRNKNQFPVRETVAFPDNAPKIMQVYSVYGKNKIDSVEIEEEKAVIEGVIEATLIYVDESDLKPVCSHSAAIPFKQVIEVKGADESMSVAVDYSVSHSSFSMLSGSEVEMRFILDTTVVVTDEKEMELIVDAVIEDADKEFIEAIPSLVIYIVGQNDTLWKIAKKYNTCLDDLLTLNEIEPGYKIYPGQKLMIMKKRVE